jgi:SAM-dependent methyltransferase
MRLPIHRCIGSKLDIPMTDIDIKNKIQGYQKAFSKYGVGPKALQWASAKAANVRYEQILKDLDLNGKSILDVGCGFGDIIDLVQKKAKNFSYTGIDVVPEFIKKARELHPMQTFITGDYYSNPPKKFYDFVITSGTLNSSSQDEQFRFRAIKTLFDNTKEAAVFNMAGGHPRPKSKKGGRVYYADSLQVLKYCFTLTNKIIFRHNYHPKDFTVVMFK